MPKIPFVKMHGLGNDFVIIAEKDLPANTLITNFAKKISHRASGIGCDQFIIYDYHDDYVSMDIYNIDGTKALACGNASRCLSRLIYDNYRQSDIVLKVGQRTLKCQYLAKDKIIVDMGAVSFNEPWMPEQSKLYEVAARYNIELKELILASVGNPHAIIFTKLSNKEQVLIGENFQNLEFFKDGINVNFAEINGDIINLRVFERGAGFTYACGSGAVATFAASCRLGFFQNNAQVAFTLGSLYMQKLGEKILMQGPGEYVCHGEYYYE